MTTVFVNVVNVPISDHDLLVIKVKCKTAQSLAVHSDFKWTKSSMLTQGEHFMFELDKIKWNEVFTSLYAEINFELFLRKLLMIFDCKLGAVQSEIGVQDEKGSMIL